MKTLLATLALACSLVACKDRDKDRDDATDTARMGADTTVTERKVQDTTIVTHDTTVRVDTTVKRGRATGPSDTVHKP
jgi:hypothetical protein